MLLKVYGNNQNIFFQQNVDLFYLELFTNLY